MPIIIAKYQVPLLATYTGAYNTLLHLDNNFTNVNPSVTWAGYQGTPVFSTDSFFGSHSMVLDGPVSNGEVLKQTSGATSLPTEWSVSSRVKFNSWNVGKVDIIWGMWSSTGVGIHLSVGDTQLIQLNADTPDGGLWDVVIAGTTVVSLGTWYHFAASYDGTTYRIFLDGNLEASIVASPTRTDLTNGMNIGGLIGNGGATDHVVDALFDEFRFLDIALYTESFTPSATAYSDVGVIGVS